MRILSFVFLLAIAYTSCTFYYQRPQNQTQNITKPTVLLISIDGYGYNYTEKYNPPNLKKFKDSGSSAESLIPVFPSKTFPNHLSMETGLYPEDHGIVAMQFMDGSREFKNSKNSSDPSFYLAEPIWKCVQRNGMVTASYFWPCSDAITPDYYFKYSQSTPNEERIVQVLNWLQFAQTEKPHLITLYFSDVDLAGHIFGPDSKELKDAIFKVDRELGLLFDTIESKKFDVNTIVVSDHGMNRLIKKIKLPREVVNDKDILISDMGPVPLFYISNQDKLEKTYALLKKLEKKEKDKFKVYKRNDIPRSLHYSKSKRIGDLVLIANPGFTFENGKPLKVEKIGLHGYNPNSVNMHGIFYAKGPQIHSGMKIKSFENIHVYSFIEKILGIDCGKNTSSNSKYTQVLVN
ncbi:MAG: ectonucleotide pyrophosphatase/phosphodiesterase [Bacteriovoracia bacterium]